MKPESSSWAISDNPQSSGQLGGHKAQGRTAETAALVVDDALAVQEAGAQMILLEAIPPEVGKYITENLTIPVLSIGAGPHCDGQLLIVSDNRPVPGLYAQIRKKILQCGGNGNQCHERLCCRSQGRRISRIRALL